MLEIITCRMSATGVWGYDFYVAENRNRIGTVSAIVSPKALVRIESAGVHWYSRFDIDTTIIPGIGRRVNDNASGEEVYRLIYWRPGLYQLRCTADSVGVEIRDGKYLFGREGMPVTALTEHFSSASWITRQDADYEPYFRTVFYEDVSETYAMMVLSFPALRFY